MKKKNATLFMLLAQLLLVTSVFAQAPWTGPGAANTTSEIYRSGKVGIGNYPSPDLPATDLEIRTINPTLRLANFNTGSPNYHSDFIQFGTYGATSTFTSQYQMGYSVYPNCGSGTFTLTGAGGAYIGLQGTKIGFGIAPYVCGSSWMIGDYLFNGAIGSKALLVAADYSAPTPPPSIPAGYKFSVNGKSEFKDHVIIGTLASFTNGTPAGYKLYVKDGILTEKVKVALANTAQWSDYVFDKEYKLRPLTEVESFIKTNQHLPDVPSATDVVSCGLDLAEMDATLLRKIEELTLYMIDMKKEMAALQQENAELKKSISQK